MSLYNNNIKKGIRTTSSLVTIVALGLYGAFLVLEPQETQGATQVSDQITASQVVDSEVTVTSPADVTLNPSIPGITGNPGAPSFASTTWNVKTNDTSGFNMKILASTTLQLNATNEFIHYTSASSSSPDYAWSTPASSEAEFGYTVEPETTADTDSRFLDNGSACNNGATNGTDTCWYKFSTSTVQIVNRSSATDSTGEDEVVKFQAESNGKFLTEGTYTAIITVIATANP